MKGFAEWLTENTLGTDEVNSQLDALYDKAKYAVKLAQAYVKTLPGPERNILKNISTVAPLSSGVYGLYNSSENKAVIGPAVANKIRFKFGADAIRQQANLQRLPSNVIRQYLPDIDPRQIAPSDVIRVNVGRIVRELGDTPEAIMEIASTIIHEATHEMEYRANGKTDEIGPKAAEARFMAWARANWDAFASRIPALASMRRA